MDRRSGVATVQPRMFVFNPHATLTVVKFDDTRSCLVLDDALLEPDLLVRYAVEHSNSFRSVGFSAYPGIYLPAPSGLNSALSDVFRLRARSRFDARRCLHTHCRLSLVTLAPESLSPIQWLCHADDSGLDPRLSMPASVLYLFKDQDFGGTSFYAPIRSSAETAALFQDARTLSPQDFTQRYDLTAGYLRTINPYFTRIGSVPARWNRLIFYDGGMLHCGDVGVAEKLSVDPSVGRLTLNGFFTCRRHLVRSAGL